MFESFKDGHHQCEITFWCSGIALWGISKTGAFEVSFEGEEGLGLLETLLFGSLIAAVDPVAVLAVFDEIKVES